MLFVVANRGLVTGLPLSWGVRAGALPDGRIDPGDAFVLRRGISVAWVGWQWDVERRPGVVGIDVPEALGLDGEPLRSPARLEFLPLAPEPHHRLADQVGPWMGRFQSLTAADLDEADATLTVRDWFNGPRERIDRARWCFGRDVDGSPVPDAEHIWLEGGFAPRRYYEVTYTTGRCPIAGTGLAAVRDGVSYLRSTMGFDRVLSTGSSQSGRWLRQFIFDTANSAEDGSRALRWGALPHRRRAAGEFNNRSAQPSTMNSLGFAYLPPFSPEDGLFASARARGNAPLTIFANSATEYWRGDASLVHTDADGRDLPDAGRLARLHACRRAARRRNARRVRGRVPGPTRAQPGGNPGRQPRPPGGAGRVGDERPASAPQRGAEGRRRFRPGSGRRAPRPGRPKPLCRHRLARSRRLARGAAHRSRSGGEGRGRPVSRGGDRPAPALPGGVGR